MPAHLNGLFNNDGVKRILDRNVYSSIDMMI